MEVTKINECRACGSPHLETVFSLEDQYVATIFIEKPEDRSKHKRYPLELVICGPGKREGCGFIQLRHTVSRDSLFGHYWYRSGINQTMNDALADIVAKAPLYADLKDGDVVCDIGCNDGTLLSFYPSEYTRIGIDPAKNMAEFSRQHADEIIVDYFSSQSYLAVSNRKAKIVTSIAMFYSVVDPIGFAESVRDILDDDGVWIIQMSSLHLMMDNNCYDNIVHEHIGYYTIDVIDQLLQRVGLYIVDGEVNDINAGSVRLYIKKQPGKTTNRIVEMRKLEAAEQYRKLSVYRKFADDVAEQTKNLIDFFETCTPENTCVYGASTKGNVILQHCRVNQDHAFGIAERNPKKYGYFTLGSNLRIIPEDEMRKRKPNNVVVLPYHFRSEIIKREAELLDAGARLIFPLPRFEIYRK